MIKLLAAIFIAYLVGSFPTSIIVGKVLQGIDIREYGSGNAGGTNAIRVLGWKLGIFVMAVDVFKGIVAVLWIAPFAFGTVSLDPQTIRLIAGCAAIIGHIWTIFAGFRGGKGVATGAGVLLVLYPLPLLVCLAIFFLVLLISRTVSVSSMSAAVAFPVVLSVFRYVLERPVPDSLYYFGFVIPVLIIFTHRSNIRELLQKT